MTDAELAATRFVSGHVYLGDITTNAFIFTILRDPLRQISSHLKWIDRYNMPEFEAEGRVLPADVQLAVRRLRHTDLSNAASIDRFLQWLPRDSSLRVVNLQAELLAFRRNMVIPLSHRKLARLAVAALSRFDFVGTTETIAADLATLFDLLGLGCAPVVPRLNEARSIRPIDLSIASIRRVLLKYVEADSRLYDHLLQSRQGEPAWRANLLGLRRLLLNKAAAD